MELGAAIAGVIVGPLRQALDEQALCDPQDLEVVDAAWQAPRIIRDGRYLARPMCLADPAAASPASPGRPRPGDGA